MKPRYSFLVAALVVSLASPAGFAARPDRANLRTVEPPSRQRVHRVVELDHPLLESEREELERMGVSLVQPVDSLRVIVRGSTAALDRLEESGLAAAIDAIGTAERLHVTAAQELLRHGGSARLEVVFHADVPLPEAVERVRAAGAWPVDPLPIRFALPRNLAVWASLDAARTLAAEDAVAVIHAPDGEIEAMNEDAAALSNVTPLYQAPYGLSGQGVVVGVIDVGNAQASHPEFEARVTAHSGATAAEHPTHVVGTIAAKGAVPKAKGMAPAVTVHQYAHDSNFLTDIETNIPALSLVAVNNSWGFITGWNYDAGKAQWGWYGRDAFGGYSSTSSAIDQLSRATNALFVFSAGNDGNDNGPSAAPWSHLHPSEADAAAVYCYSSDGSGTDCPATTCGKCEVERHPPDGTWGTMSRTGSSKSGIAVGAVGTSKLLGAFSSRGPTRDGRVKPDLVAKGVSQYSTVPGGAYGRLQGTSMSTPVVTGIAALLVEQWRKTAGADPGAALLKALLIHGARDLGIPGPDYAYGWGLVDAKTPVDTMIADGARGERIIRGSVGAGEAIEYLLDAPPGEPARVTLVWLDPETTPFPVNETTLINDLDLRVVGPRPTTFSPWVLYPGEVDTPASLGANRRDTVEVVDFEPPVAGSWRAIVRGVSIPAGGKQEFVLVSSVPVRGTQPSCSDPFEPNDHVEEAWGRLRSGRSIASRLCDATDVDYFWFLPDSSGPVEVTVTAGAAPLEVILVGPDGIGKADDLPAGQTRTIGRGPAEGGGRYHLSIAAAGTPSGEATYVFRPAFPSTASPRARTARR